MIRKILGAAMRNVKRFFGVWLVVLIANQVFIFGGCVAPHCLAAALPHTLLIALLVNLFAFNQAEDTNSTQVPRRASVGPGESTAVDSKPQSPPSDRVNRRVRQLGIVSLCVTVISALLYLSVSGKPSLSPTADAWEHEARADIPVERPLSEELAVSDSLAGEVPDERAPPEEVLNGGTYSEAEAPDRHPGSEQRRNEGTKTYRCTNSSGKPGIGTGRLSRANEYSSFLERSVGPGEFVVFKYQGSGKEYWFKASGCELI